MKNQQDSSKGKIYFDLAFDEYHNDYFKWILNGFDAYEKTKLDLLTFKNTKSGQPIIKIKHSKVTDD